MRVPDSDMVQVRSVSIQSHRPRCGFRRGRTPVVERCGESITVFDRVRDGLVRQGSSSVCLHLRRVSEPTLPPKVSTGDRRVSLQTIPTVRGVSNG